MDHSLTALHVCMLFPPLSVPRPYSLHKAPPSLMDNSASHMASDQILISGSALGSTQTWTVWYLLYLLPRMQKALEGN